MKSLQSIFTAGILCVAVGTAAFAQQQQQQYPPVDPQQKQYPQQQYPQVDQRQAPQPNGGYQNGQYQNQGGQYQAPPMNAMPPTGDITLPAGTLISVRMNQPLSSDHNQPGDGFTATLQQPLVASGYVIARRGQTVVGRVTVAEKAGHVKGTSKLGIELGELTLVDGQQSPLHTELVQQRGGTSYGRDAAGIATTTGVGAAIGAGVNGGVGAGVGAAAGLVTGIIGVMVSRGQQTVIYPETLLTFRITAPVTVSTAHSAMAFLPVTPDDYGNGHPMMTRQAPGHGEAPYGGGYYVAPGGYYPYNYGFYGWGPSFYFSGGRGYGYFRGGWRR